MGRKLLSNEYIDSFLESDGRGITRHSDYLGADYKVTFRCSHEHEFHSIANKIKRGSGCPECFGNKKLSKEEINNQIAGRGITFIGEYLNAKTKTMFQCECGHQWETTPNKIKRGSGCPKCYIKNISSSKKEFQEWLAHNDREIVIIGEYSNNNTKTLFGCECGHQWEASPVNIKNGRGCPVCAEYGFNPSKPAWEYVFKRDGYIKYGITNNLQQRLNSHRKHGYIVLLHERYHEVGQLALDWENGVKRTHGGRYVTKEKCPDGYTETLPIHLLEAIIV
jgi:hypothetical protein